MGLFKAAFYSNIQKDEHGNTVFYPYGFGKGYIIPENALDSLRKFNNILLVIAFIFGIILHDISMFNSLIGASSLTIMIFLFVSINSLKLKKYERSEIRRSFSAYFLSYASLLGWFGRLFLVLFFALIIIFYVFYAFFYNWFHFTIIAFVFLMMFILNLFIFKYWVTNKKL